MMTAWCGDPDPCYPYQYQWYPPAPPAWTDWGQSFAIGRLADAIERLTAVIERHLEKLEDERG